jgi:hypothetical protein
LALPHRSQADASPKLQIDEERVQTRSRNTPCVGLSEINISLLIYHVEDVAGNNTARLIYADKHEQ